LVRHADESGKGALWLAILALLDYRAPIRARLWQRIAPVPVAIRRLFLLFSGGFRRFLK